MLFAPMALLTHLIFLSDLDLTGVTQEWGVAGKNKSVDGKPISIGGQTFVRGIGTHATSSFEIDLRGGAESFDTYVGVDDEAPQGTVVFQVWVDGVKKAESPLMKGADAAYHMVANLLKAKKLQLRVTNGGDSINYDHADWAEPKVILNDRVNLTPVVMKPKKEETMKIASSKPTSLEINGPRIVGCTPGNPFQYKIPATSAGPVSFKVLNLPRGLRVDPQTGIISGKLLTSGNWRVNVQAKSGRNTVTRDLSIVSGFHNLALTPPMGWNSWNVWGTSVDAQKVRDSADAFIKAGLANYGYQYVNIDDAWEGDRDGTGTIRTNEKFGDMGALADYVHAKGLKLGIYSSPGPKTCANYTASYRFESNDANSYASWGIDYLKYDWCSYDSVAKDHSLAELQKPYLVMREALDKCGRDIVFSLCQYGMGDVFKWGKQVGGNLWRTTGDIEDTWQSMSGIGFDHSRRALGVSPGGWNDPDMLVVGKLGWGPSPRASRLSGNEQITHITLWSMLAAPLIIGCDLTQMDQFTKDVLMNHDVIEVDQDALGKAAVRKWQEGDIEVWTRPLFDGTSAVAVFNRGMSRASVHVSWKSIGLPNNQLVRNLWLRKNLGFQKLGARVLVPSHGAQLFKVGSPR